MLPFFFLYYYILIHKQSGNTQTTDSVCKKILAAAGIELGSEDIKEISVDGIDATPGYTKATRIIMGALESHNSPTKPTFSKRGLSPANENSCGTTGNQEDCMVAITENSWYYQVCSQMGYFQNTDSENDYLVFENLKGDLDQCVKTFGQSVAKGPSLNPQKYGGKDLNLSNTFWADGQYDPWRAATPNSFNSGRVPSQNIPEAGKTLEGNQFFGIVVNDTFHTPLHACVGIVLAGTKDLDMAATNLVTATNLDCKPGVFEAQQLFLDAIVSWLPSFKGINNTATLTTEAGKATAVARGTA